MCLPVENLRVACDIKKQIEVERDGFRVASEHITVYIASLPFFST
jgi:hypothetical protein